MTAGCTIVAKSYLSLARTLARSFRAHHPDTPFFVLLADDVDGYFDPAREPFTLVRWDDLPEPWRHGLRFTYTQQPLSYAATPLFLSHLFDRGFTRLLFFKQEGLVLGSHQPMLDALERHSVVLTPHALAPLTGPDRVARELNLLQSGVFNVGVLAVADRPSTRTFLSWWLDRTSTHCRHSVAEGMHYEQRWLDFVPAFIEDALVWRDPAYNVGHWNVTERRVDVVAGEVRVHGERCRLFRFSGYSPDAPEVVTRYSTRLSPSALGSAWQVFERYRQSLEDDGYFETSRWPYAFATFDNGVAIPDVARVIYQSLGDGQRAFGDPRCTGVANSFFQWLLESAHAGAPADSVSRLWRWVYDHRPDLQAAFPDLTGAELEGFHAWTRAHGAAELSVPEPFLPVRAGAPLA